MVTKRKRNDGNASGDDSGDENNLHHIKGRMRHRVSLEAINSKTPNPLKWDKDGLPYGDYAGFFASWIGCCVRQYVPLSTRRMIELSKTRNTMLIDRIKVYTMYKCFS